MQVGVMNSQVSLQRKEGARESQIEIHRRFAAGFEDEGEDRE